MKLKLLHNLFALTIAVGLFAGFANAAPAQNAGTKEKATLIDEATPTASGEPAAKSEAGKNAEEPTNSQAATAAQTPSACEHAAPEKKSDIPIFPIVISSIGTIAFIVLAILF